MEELKDKINDTSEPQEYLFKDFLNCGICNKKIKLHNDMYSCKKGCISLDIFPLSIVIIEQILNSIDLVNIEEILTLKIDILSSKLAEDKEIIF